MKANVLILLSDKFSNEKGSKMATDEISLIIERGDVKCYYDNKNSYFVFKSNPEEYDVIYECLEQWLSEDNINFVMVSVGDGSSMINLPQEVHDLVFNVMDIEIETHGRTHISSDDDSDFIDFMGLFDEEVSDIEKIKRSSYRKQITVDEILDKITEKGIKSLTEEEIKILKSKSIH
jgi:hypothetical protein